MHKTHNVKNRTNTNQMQLQTLNKTEARPNQKQPTTRMDDRSHHRSTQQQVAARATNANTQMTRKTKRAQQNHARVHTQRRHQNSDRRNTERATRGVLARRHLTAVNDRAARAQQTLNNDTNERNITTTAIALNANTNATFKNPQRGHPVTTFGHATAALETVAHHDSHRTGAIYTALLISAITNLAATTKRQLPRTLIRAITLWIALNKHSLLHKTKTVTKLIKHNNIANAHQRIPSLINRDPHALNATKLCATTIESIAENTINTVITPLL